MPLPSRILTRSRPDALGVVAVVRDQHALDVIGMVDDPGVGLAPGRVDAVDVAVAGEQLAHALEGVVRRADVELQLGLGGLAVWACGMRSKSCGRRIKRAAILPCLQPAAITETARANMSPTHANDHEDAGGLRNTLYRRMTRSNRRMTAGRRLAYRLAVPLGAGAHPAVLAAVPRGARRGRRAHRCGAREGAVADSRATGISISSSAASISFEQTRARPQAGLAHQPFGGRRDRRDDGAALRRARRSAARPRNTGARALRDYYQALMKDGVSPVDHAGWAAGPALQIQAGRDPARADVAAGRSCRWPLPHRAPGSSSGTSSCCPGRSRASSSRSARRATCRA